MPEESKSSHSAPAQNKPTQNELDAANKDALKHLEKYLELLQKNEEESKEGSHGEMQRVQVRLYYYQFECSERPHFHAYSEIT